MVQTNSHRFNTHVKRLSLSASVVIIIITRLLKTSRIITQYFNHLLLYNFTTSPLKIVEPLSTFQICHSWLGSFMFLFCLVFAMFLCASVYMRFVVTCRETADLLALVCGVCCEFVTFPLVSWVRCGTWLYRFLIFVYLLTWNIRKLIWLPNSWLFEYVFQVILCK